MTHLISQAHAETFSVVKSNMVRLFGTLGYLYNTQTSAIKPAPLKSFGYRFEAIEEVSKNVRAELLEEAKEKEAQPPLQPPKAQTQRTIKFFFAVQ